MKTYMITIQYLVDAERIEESIYHLIGVIGEDRLPKHGGARIKAIECEDDRTLLNVDLQEAIDQVKKINDDKT